MQEAACSAFATLEEDAERNLVPYLGPILQNLMFAYAKYQAKNLLMLYDAIGTLADAVGSDLNKPEHVAVLMPPLIAKWAVVPDDDKSIFPMLECFTSVAQALGLGFAPYAEAVFARCASLIESTLRTAAADAAAADKEFVVCSLDLISGMIEGMGPAVEPLVQASNLPALLLVCMRDPVADVRQSAYALVGDLAKACIAQLAPRLAEYLPILTQQLEPELVSVCNNASWAIGEVAIKVGPEVRPFVEAVVQRLVPIVTRAEGQVNKSLLENTAITLGRLGLVAPDLVAPMLATFIAPWCVALRSIRDDVEKEHACLGLCQLIKLNPHAPLNAMVQMCDAFASWGAPSAELNENFRVIVVGYKGSIPADQWDPPLIIITELLIIIRYKGSIPADQWDTFYATFPPDLRQRLTERYGL